MESAQGTGGAARLMHASYNETAVDWSTASQTEKDFTDCVQRYFKACPDRFQNIQLPFTICDYGCTDGGSSVPALRTIIKAVREISPDMPMQIYLNDLPENRFDIAIGTVTKGLAHEGNVFVMAVGKDFTTQVFPRKHIDFGFSTLTLMIISHAPAPLIDNIFFIATPEAVKTHEGKLWIDALKKHFQLFLEMRAKELKPHGQLFISVMPHNEPDLKPYQKKELQFYGRIAQSLLPECLQRNGIKSTNETLAACMKTTTFAYPSHYFDASSHVGDQLALIAHETVDVPDLFYQHYQQSPKSDETLKAFSQEVSRYIKGFWCEVLEQGLKIQLCEDQNKVKKVSQELFDELLPVFVQKKPDLYPECYQVLKLSFQRL